MLLVFMTVFEIYLWIYSKKGIIFSWALHFKWFFFHLFKILITNWQIANYFVILVFSFWTLRYKLTYLRVFCGKWKKNVNGVHISCSKNPLNFLNSKHSDTQKMVYAFSEFLKKACKNLRILDFYIMTLQNCGQIWIQGEMGTLSHFCLPLPKQ